MGIEEENGRSVKGAQFSNKNETMDNRRTLFTIDALYGIGFVEINDDFLSQDLQLYSSDNAKSQKKGRKNNKSSKTKKA